MRSERLRKSRYAGEKIREEEREYIVQMFSSKTYLKKKELNFYETRDV